MPTDVLNHLKTLRDGVADELRRDPRYQTLQSLDKSIAEITNVLAAAGMLTPSRQPSSLSTRLGAMAPGLEALAEPSGGGHQPALAATPRDEAHPASPATAPDDANPGFKEGTVSAPQATVPTEEARPAHIDTDALTHADDLATTMVASETAAAALHGAAAVEIHEAATGHSALAADAVTGADEQVHAPVAIAGESGETTAGALHDATLEDEGRAATDSHDALTADAIAQADDEVPAHSDEVPAHGNEGAKSSETEPLKAGSSETESAETESQEGVEVPEPTEVPAPFTLTDEAALNLLREAGFFDDEEPAADAIYAEHESTAESDAAVEGSDHAEAHAVEDSDAGHAIAGPVKDAAHAEVPSDGATLKAAVPAPAVHESALHEPEIHKPEIHEPAIHEPAIHEAAIHEAAIHREPVDDARTLHEPVAHDAAAHEASSHDIPSHDVYGDGAERHEHAAPDDAAPELHAGGEVAHPGADAIASPADAPFSSDGGYIPMAARPEATQYAPSIAVKFGKLPNKVDLRSLMPPVDEGTTAASRVADAVAGAYEYWIKKAAKRDRAISRLFVYYNARWRDGAQDRDGGCSIQFALEGLQRFGACAAAAWPPEPDRVVARPDAAAYQEASTTRIHDLAQVPLRLEAWKQALAEGKPVMFGIAAFLAFETCAERGGLVAMPAPDDLWQQNPDHAFVGRRILCAVGYNEGERVFIARNAAGSAFGDDGHCYLPYDYVLNPAFNDGDCWVFVPRVPLQPPRETWQDETHPVIAGGAGLHDMPPTYPVADYTDVAAALEHALLPWTPPIDQAYVDYAAAVSRGQFAALPPADDLPARHGEASTGTATDPARLTA